jgi:hypothetical protein
MERSSEVTYTKQKRERVSTDTRGVFMGEEMKIEEALS